MTLENPHFQQEIHLHSWLIFHVMLDIREYTYPHVGNVKASRQHTIQSDFLVPENSDLVANTHLSSKTQLFITF